MSRKETSRPRVRGGAAPNESAGHNRNSSDLPDGWDRVLDEYGQPYYVNLATQRVQKSNPIFSDATSHKQTSGFAMHNQQQNNSMNSFIDPEQWDIVIDTMASSIHPDDQIKVFEKLKKNSRKTKSKR